MPMLADQITRELRVLVGQPIGDCWRAMNMAIFEFGPRREFINRNGDQVDTSDIRLHIQGRWRFVDAERILFARDDILYPPAYPADDSVSLDDFDWDKEDSILDIKRRAWFEQYRADLPRVVSALGDKYGGFRIELERGFALECFPCDSLTGAHSEQWRLLGHRADESHFVVTGGGMEDCDDQ